VIFLLPIFWNNGARIDNPSELIIYGGIKETFMILHTVSAQHRGINLSNNTKSLKHCKEHALQVSYKLFNSVQATLNICLCADKLSPESEMHVTLALNLGPMLTISSGQN
jgi:hypothetical protein